MNDTTEHLIDGLYRMIQKEALADPLYDWNPIDEEILKAKAESTKKVVQILLDLNAIKEFELENAEEEK